MRGAIQLGLCLALLSCRASGHFGDPTVVVESEGRRELGVSTEYGVVFLGRWTQTGPMRLVAWFPDGPSFESGVVEPIGSGLYTTETEIVLASVPLTFHAPSTGDEVTIVGRDGRDPWELSATVASHPAVDGLLLEESSDLTRLDADQVGAGVYVGKKGHRKLVGLVSGWMRLEIDGRFRDYVTVVGPRDLWRLVTHRRNPEARRRWVYREDIL